MRDNNKRYKKVKKVEINKENKPHFVLDIQDGGSKTKSEIK